MAVGAPAVPLLAGHDEDPPGDGVDDNADSDDDGTECDDTFDMYRCVIMCRVNLGQ